MNYTNTTTNAMQFMYASPSGFRYPHEAAKIRFDSLEDARQHVQKHGLIDHLESIQIDACTASGERYGCTLVGYRDARCRHGVRVEIEEVTCPTDVNA